ncbi:hypothetical protein EV702DRAFT_1071634 [Suillus placidus]|uniref:Uncharacterized protein n=1 Tax=Suillus placidus TaxID=48579 RepID=A0A9P7A353_9AGAM|nr:hypothetical protein EV702DRAFT_1071634 [Suillus placidus]
MSLRYKRVDLVTTRLVRVVYARLVTSLLLMQLASYRYIYPVPFMIHSALYGIFLSVLPFLHATRALTHSRRVHEPHVTFVIQLIHSCQFSIFQC